MDERAIDSARRAADTMTGKDPGEEQFILSLVKSGFRILGCLLFIVLGFTIDEMLLCYGAGMFFAAEILNIAAKVLNITEEII